MWLLISIYLKNTLSKLPLTGLIKFESYQISIFKVQIKNNSKRPPILQKTLRMTKSNNYLYSRTKVLFAQL